MVSRIFDSADKSSIEAKTKPKWFTPYWIVLFVFWIVVAGIIFPVVLHQPLEQAILWLIVGLLILSFGYYIRIRPPSMSINRIIYIVLLGFVIGTVFWMVTAFFLSRIYNTGVNQYIAVIIDTAVCYGLGGLIGDLIGRKRHYKTAIKYSP